jgi:hypothetical protein
MIDAELVSEYVASCETLLDAADQVNKLIHEAGDASVLKDWRHFDPDEIPAMLEVLRLDRLKNGKAIAAALGNWSENRFAAHKKYGEVIARAEHDEFLKLPKPDRFDRGALSSWQAYFSAATKM